MLVSQFLLNFLNAPKWARINVESVENYGLTYKITTEETIKDAAQIIQGLKDDLDSSDREIRKLDESLRKEEWVNEELESKIDALYSELEDYKISPTDTVGNLISRNEELTSRVSILQEALNKFSRRHDEDQREITNLKARKNKATVKKCLTTGRLMASFNGVEYELTKK